MSDDATPQILFELVDGRMRPALPLDPEGNPRVADGRTFLTVEQAATLVNRAPASLRAEHAATYKDLRGDATQVMAPTPSAATGETPAQLDVARQRAALLRAHRFNFLEPAEFEYFLERCRQLGLNAWSNQVYAEKRVNARTMEPEVVLIVGINGLRALAHRTGTYAGCGKIDFEYDADGRVVSATSYVKRLVDGKPRRFPATVFWDDYAPAPDADLEGLWSKPHMSLGRVCRAATIREGFEMGDVYTPEEMAQARRGHSDPDAQDVTRSRTIRPAAPTDPTCATFDKFMDELERLGFEDETGRVMLLRHFRERHPALADASPRHFWAKILQAVRAAPQRYEQFRSAAAS